MFVTSLCFIREQSSPAVQAYFGYLYCFVGMIVAVGISSLQYVNMNSGRNLFIIGFSLFAGLAIPQWMLANPTAIHTGMAFCDI